MAFAPLLLACSLLVGQSLGKSLEDAGERDRDSRAANGRVVLFDDFTGTELDMTKWKFDISASRYLQNHEFQMYTPEPGNTYIKNGMLHIKPTLTEDHFGAGFVSNGKINFTEQWGTCTSQERFCHVQGWNSVPPVMAAMVMSKASIRYGRLEVTGRLPRGDWLWPAIWLMPTESHYGSWPRSGEIDVMEARGNLHLVNRDGDSMGVDTTFVHMPHGPDVQHHKGGEWRYTLPHGNFGTARHTWWMDWTADYIKIGVDNHTMVNRHTPADGNFAAGHYPGTNPWTNGGKDAPYDRPFYLLLNVAVGGHFFNQNMHNTPYQQPWHDGWSNNSMEFWNAHEQWKPTWHGDSSAFRIDSVKMIQYNEGDLIG